MPTLRTSIDSMDENADVPTVSLETHPELLHTVIDTTDPRALAEFYRQLLGYVYRDGDEPIADNESPVREEHTIRTASDDADWLVLTDSSGHRKLAFQQVEHLAETTWPSPDVPMQMHLDLTVTNLNELEHQRQRAEELGAQVISDRTDDLDEPLYVLADPAGHPFCIFVA